MVDVTQIVRDNIPDDRQVDAEILVGNDITQPGNLTPFDGRSLVALGLWNMLCCLTDDLKVAHNGINAHLIGLEGSKINPAGVPFDPGDCLQDILQIQAIVPRHR